MNKNRTAFKYASSQEGGINPPCTGLIPDVLSEVQKSVWVKNLHTGVFTLDAQLRTEQENLILVYNNLNLPFFSLYYHYYRLDIPVWMESLFVSENKVKTISKCNYWLN
ncbi:hypothetical protein [Bacteroides helcogenes]|uniref:Uncharacterized protein n=1 Tax=Bacteroides helcogenes (strain ATCC 35417 / DSM 20613 / JCM 6297 / CCUG 15421 / P 36-108) TaxID=693979 RepID=E6SR80_BACT6|nr:hypothetical protein [Bacteroides helcogenes]ADV43024.1 hypothetical protein Bache_1013 [Bacteroides helcogenes P 36-108]MDY5236931.1 hypothetical protein [Bacteroides helcogenes]